MLGLIGTLYMGSRSMQVQKQGVEVAGHNLANVNNPAYSRQRVDIQTSPAMPTPIGPQGTGADVVSIQRLRDGLIDSQIQTETSLGGFFEEQQNVLQQAQTVLGQQIDRAAAGPDGSAAAPGVGSQYGLAERLSDLFNAFQEVSTNPSSLPERQAALAKAQDLAAEFNQIEGRLGDLGTSLNTGLQSDLDQVNQSLGSIAQYNKDVAAIEVNTPGAANDLRDLRQQKIEALAKLVNIQTVEQANGAVDVSVAGAQLVSGAQRLDTLEAYDAGGGQLLVRTQTGGTALNLSSGQVQGLIEVRDGELATLRQDLNQLASVLMTEVNGLHASGFSLTGSTGAALFNGSNAADIQVNTTLLASPALFQASGAAGEAGNNQVTLALAQLADQAQSALSNQTFSQEYGRFVAGVGQSLDSANSALEDQKAVQNMLLRQRDSVSGVSIDEEMTDLIKYQKAFEASARLVVTVDEMLQTVLGLKR
jgi:flagellar hook-associated protein 1